MFMGEHASAQGGSTPGERWPELTIELRQVLLIPPSGPSIGTARPRQTAV